MNFGIDLGTSTSLIGYIGKIGPTLAKDIGSTPIFPSVVRFTDSDVIVGNAARRSRSNTKGMIYDSKIMIGRPYNDPYVQKKKEVWPFDISDNGQGEIEIGVPYRVNRMKPEEVSGEILKYLVQKVNQKLPERERSKSVVVSVPAKFDHAQRKATKRAAEYAGLNVLCLINEPTAAAIACNFARKENVTLLVFDFGGGTLDVSLIEVSNEGKKFVTKAVAGDVNLGGRDIDEILMRHFEEQKDITFKYTPNERLKLQKACEQAKIDL